jgi:predicted enzyme related to lactoylglutathione lyase
MLVPMAQTHHAIDYVELNVTDLEAAQSFYGTAFGWRFTSYGPSYASIHAVDGDDEVGGLNLDPDVGPVGVLVQLYSADLDGTVAAVRSAGGTIVDEPYAFPGGRRFTFLDPSGNRLGVWAES